MVLQMHRLFVGHVFMIKFKGSVGRGGGGGGVGAAKCPSMVNRN